MTIQSEDSYTEYSLTSSEVLGGCFCVVLQVKSFGYVILMLVQIIMLAKRSFKEDSVSVALVIAACLAISDILVFTCGQTHYETFQFYAYSCQVLHTIHEYEGSWKKLLEVSPKTNQEVSFSLRRYERNNDYCVAWSHGVLKCLQVIHCKFFLSLSVEQ